MKKVILSFSILTSISACKKNEIPVFDGKILHDSKAPKNIAKQVETFCFEYSKNQDTTEISLNIDKNNQVLGKMNWKPNEKDGAFGILKGTKKGDTIVVDFDYMIEGAKQLEEKVFVLKNDRLIELIGVLEDRNGKLVLKDLKKITVRNTLLLKDCSAIKFPN